MSGVLSLRRPQEKTCDSRMGANLKSSKGLLATKCSRCCAPLAACATTLQRCEQITELNPARMFFMAGECFKSNPHQSAQTLTGWCWTKTQGSDKYHLLLKKRAAAGGTHALGHKQVRQAETYLRARKEPRGACAAFVLARVNRLAFSEPIANAMLTTC